MKNEDVNSSEFYLPKWLPMPVRGIVKELHKITASDFQILQKSPPEHIEYHIAYRSVCYFNRLAPVFTDNSLEDVWDDLYKKSPKNTVKFARSLFNIENYFEYVKSEFERNKKNIEWREEIVKTASILIKQINKNKKRYGSRFNLCSDSFYNELVAIKETASKVANSLEEDCALITELCCPLAPISRKYKSSSALPTFFARSIYILFKRLYNEPMYSKINKLVGIIFPETQYNENSITKMMTDIKDLSLDAVSITIDGLPQKRSKKELISLLFESGSSRIGGGILRFY